MRGGSVVAEEERRSAEVATATWRKERTKETVAVEKGCESFFQLAFITFHFLDSCSP